MAGSIFGQIFKVSTFGESHGPGVGVVIDGCPAGFKINRDFLNKELAKRKPGRKTYTTTRAESDEFQILSGVIEDVTTGAPVCIYIPNTDVKSKDYEELENVYRPSHADYAYFKKYNIKDHRGGGRASARETVVRVAAGAVAKMLLQQSGIKIKAFVSAIGPYHLERNFSFSEIENANLGELGTPDTEITFKILSHLKELKANGDTAGGIITCMIQNCPAGLGEPVFDKFDAELAKAMMSIPSVKGFEIGSGFSAAAMSGSRHNDAFESHGSSIRTKTNFSGGVQGGITNGEEVYFNVAFKPVSSISREQTTVNDKGENVKIKVGGRHDVCVVPRAVVIVEAMAAIVTADLLLRNRSSRI